MKKHMITISLGLGAALALTCLAKKTDFFENDQKLYDEFDSTLNKNY